MKMNQLTETPIDMTGDPNDPTIYGHEKANPMSIKGRIMSARAQLKELAQLAESDDLIAWEKITRLAKGGMFMGLEQNLEQIRHGIEQLAAKRKQGGVQSRGIDKNIGEAISKKDLVGRLQKDLPKITDPRNKDAKPAKWTGPGKDDYGYTGYQGHGMPTDKQERESAKKNKGVAEGKDDKIKQLRQDYADKLRWSKEAHDPAQQRQHRMGAGTIANHLKKQYGVDVTQGVAEAMSQRNKDQGAIGHGLPWKRYDDLDQLAQDISDKILTITNIVKLNNMAHDSTIYNTLERYFKKYGYPDNVFNRVASIVFKKLDDEGRRMTTDPRIQEQDVAEEGYGTHPSQRVDPLTGKKYIPPKSPLGKGVAEGKK